MANRDELRSITVGKKPAFAKEIVEWEGKKFEIRQPSIRSRRELRSKATSVKDGDVVVDFFNFLIWAVIENTFVPDTDEKVFEETDYDLLMDFPTGGFMDTFGEVAAKLLNVEVETKKKLSEQTEKDSLLSE